MSQTKYRIVEIPKEWVSSKGSGTVVAVCDSGCDDTHEAIKDNIIEYRSFFPTGKKIMSGDHSTHVCGIIVSTAPECSLLVGQAMGLEKGKLDYLELALKWALENNADVINLSLSYFADKPRIKKHLQDNYDNGAIICAAQGLYPNKYPASYEWVVSVGAYESYLPGPEIDLYAPKTFESSVPINQYKKKSGHSMSAAYISGIASLAKSYDKSIDKNEFLRILKSL